MQERQITFSELRNAYLSVKQIVFDKWGEIPNHYKTKIEQDLGMYGDDNYFFLLNLIEKYQLNFEEFNYDLHFVGEFGGDWDEMDLPLDFLLMIFIFAKFITVQIIKLFSSKISIIIKNFFTEYYLTPIEIEWQNRPKKLDLTIGDLVASLTEKRFTLKSNIKYVLVKGNH